jgi:two-component system, OmpR family, sensor kinase
MNRLWVRLTLAFGLLSALAALLVALLVSWQTDSQVRRFLAREQLANSPLVADLSAYYGAHGSWEGVAELFTADRAQVAGSGIGPGMMQHLHLLDAEGGVVYTSGGRTAAGTSVAVPILWQGQPVGTLELGPGQGMMAGRGMMAAPTERFLAQVRRAALLVALLTGLLGAALGLVLARGIAAPLDAVTAAAQHIAQGERAQRVPEQGSAELRALAEAFNTMAANLEQAEQQRKRLIADVAHELRTPLSVLQGNLRAILDEVYPLDRREIATLYDETLLLSRLVADLHELAQAEGGQLPLALQPTDLSACIRRAAELFAETAQAQGISLETSLPPNLPLALAEPTRLQQVLHNLLANALRHTPAPGSVSIASRLRDDGMLEVAVADSGEGIFPEDLPHVFERFWRGDRARQRGGTGLGLAIAKQLINAQGGTIGVTSVRGQGSQFWFTLPVAA